MYQIHGFKKMKFSDIMPGFNQGEMIMLKMINECLSSSGTDAVRVSDIAAKACFPMPAVSRGLGDLERRGFITRSIDPSDRRNTLVRMTAEGKKAADEAYARMDEFMDDVFSVFTEDEMEQFVDLQERLRRSFEDEIAKRKAACAGEKTGGSGIPDTGNRGGESSR